MNSFVIVQYSKSDLLPIIQLLKENNLPSSDIEAGKQVFFVAEYNDTIIGCIGIEEYNSFGLIRSLAVTKSKKNLGLGKKLHTRAIENCIVKGLKKTYLLTSTADNYFELLGWKQIKRADVPSIIQSSKEFSSICPSTAICMELSLFPYIAGKLFSEGFNCAQSTFYPFAVRSGILPEAALKLTTGFGSGMVYRGETCGAVTGVMMAIGLIYGRSEANDYDSKDKTYMLIKEMYKRFCNKHGSIVCKELLKLENNSPESWDRANSEGLFETHCPLFVKDAVIITEELLKK